MPASPSSPRPGEPGRGAVTRLGLEGAPIAIIDNAVEDPGHWRSVGCGLDWAARGDYYPGPRAHAPGAYLAAMTRPLQLALSQVFGWRGRFEVLRCLFSLATTAPAQLALAQRVPHVDSYDPDQVAFVHYLCAPEWGGTAFFRHRSTGFERVDPHRASRFETALASDFARTGEPAADYIGPDDALFECLYECEARFNRVVFFPGNQLHCAVLGGRNLPDDPALGRLTVAGFLRPAS